jgi:hypothetical protein
LSANRLDFCHILLQFGYPACKNIPFMLRGLVARLHDIAHPVSITHPLKNAVDGHDEIFNQNEETPPFENSLLFP